jgi:RimJ/RimL family protein N-acetyltransferase
MAQDSFHRAGSDAAADRARLSVGVAPREVRRPGCGDPDGPGRDDGITRRPERAEDLPFLAALFRSSALPELARMPVDDATKDALVRMQFASQTATYRAQFPQARFEIIEQRGTPVGRIVVDPGGEVACIVDLALLPECRGRGIGGMILADVMRQFAAPKRRVQCKVLAHNEASLRMCRRVGFVPTAALPPFLQLEW